MQPKPIIAAIHGIMTRQSVASWPDLFDAWCDLQGIDAKVIKKEYLALPLPAFNVFAKNWLLAMGLAAEIELLATQAEPAPTELKHTEAQDQIYRMCADVEAGNWPAEAAIKEIAKVARLAERHTETPKGGTPYQRPIHFVSHSNGTDVAMKTIRILANRGIKTESTVFIGSVLRSDITRNGVARLIGEGFLQRAYAYCSRSDRALSVPRLLPWCAYGHLGITGFKLSGQVQAEFKIGSSEPDVVTRRFDRYGHGEYFSQWNTDQTFALITEDMGLTQGQAGPAPTHEVREWNGGGR